MQIDDALELANKLGCRPVMLVLLNGSGGFVTLALTELEEYNVNRQALKMSETRVAKLDGKGIPLLLAFPKGEKGA